MSYEEPTWAYEIRILIRLRFPHTPRSVSHTFSCGSSYVLIRFLIRMKSLAWRMRSLTWGSGWGEREHQCHVDSYTENNRKWVSGKASADTRKSMWSGNSSARGDRASFIKQIAQNAFWWTEWDPQPEVGCWREIARERERERERERAKERESEREKEKRESDRERV